MADIGITGTRNGASPAQREWLYGQLHNHDRLHHGACVGVDETSHWAAISIGGYTITVHPPAVMKYRMSLDNLLGVGMNTRGLPNTVTTLPTLGYHQRDRAIVTACDELLAMPDGPWRLHSGTWYTIEYARQVGRPGTICYPDGTTEPI